MQSLRSPSPGTPDISALARIREPLLLGAFELPPLYPEWLGDRSFTQTHGVRFPYVVGAMANGIASVELVQASARAGILAFFGAGGLAYPRVEAAIEQLRGLDRENGGRGHAWGANLIHSPNEPELEARVADLYIRTGVRRVSASAFMGLTANVVRYACAGLHVDSGGAIVRRNHVFAKVSRPEVARHFMAPAPAELLRELVAAGLLSESEAALGAQVPLAADVTAEADSGGHTDNRPLPALLPVLMRLRDELEARHGYVGAIRVGAAGGLGTPSAVAGAFALGADYVLTGSVNQAAVESGISPAARELLAGAGLADVAMAAAADMFEQGVKLQVLSRGTMFAIRANKLYRLYHDYAGIEALPAAERAGLERQVFRMSLDEVWAQTQAFWRERDPAQLARAAAEPKHRMALMFRWYLGLSSRWAIGGDPQRRVDYQIWCGPAMGAFNEWVRGSFLEPASARTVVQIALNLLEGAAVITRAQQLRSFGVDLPASAFDFRPRPLG
ncbi:MAG: PfaD family polyunsaturated fatty acid/polyketide biosynthesis protein [Myxococcales bacterium]|nr:PfaD family polyunsaturated fatty acid/polyketide biosynthesis protein [Myxococcales bacterium]